MLDPTSLSRADALGQLFMIGFHGYTPTPEIIDLIERERVGGVILFRRNIRDAEQVRKLTSDLQSIARAAGHSMPLLISVDQENGLVQRFGRDVTMFPGNMALGATGDESLVTAIAQATGVELRTLGVNMNLAPDADVNNNPANPLIGVRSFGEDPQLVARLTAAAIRGYREAGAVATLKHFPGHGDTATDSHLGLPVVPFTLERLRSIELVPFVAGIAAGAECVMIAHMLLTELTPGDTRPATISPFVVETLLRGELGFKGVIMTDCLEMEAIAGTVGVTEGARQALHAGNDLVLISHTFERQRSAIAAALADPEITDAAIRQHAERVMRLKVERLAWDASLPAIDRAAHQQLSSTGFARSVTLVRDDSHRVPLRLDPAQHIVIVTRPPAEINNAVDITYDHATFVDAVRAHHANVSSMVLTHTATQDDITEVLVEATSSDLIILVTINADRDPAQAELLRSLVARGRPMVVIAACDPYDLGMTNTPVAALATYEYSTPALAAAVGVLFGEISPQGHLPVSIAQ